MPAPGKVARRSQQVAEIVMVFRQLVLELDDIGVGTHQLLADRNRVAEGHPAPAPSPVPASNEPRLLKPFARSSWYMVTVG